MNLELITTGSELLLGLVTNTHVNFIARQLLPLGHRINRHTTVGDDPAALRAAITDALARADILLITGGLGPTSDDITRDIVAELLGRKLLRDDAVAAAITERVRRRGLKMLDQLLVQALVPEGATVLPNLNGTAPGLAIEHKGKLIVLLPGPPRELQPMFIQSVLPLLPRNKTGTLPQCRSYKIAGLPESVVEEKVAPVLAGLPDLELGYCARPGEVEVRVITPRLAEAEQRIRAALGTDIFGTDADRLEEVVVKMLTESRKTVATAESCTGGLIANRLTNVSGSSAVFLTGYVTYSNTAKQRDLGVRAETLEEFGAVSEQVAREMAEGARTRTGADFALSATGIAGPIGGTPDKPVGLVFIGLATPTYTKVCRWQITFDRETLKFFVSQTALDLLRRELRVGC